MGWSDENGSMKDEEGSSYLKWADSFFIAEAGIQ
jgi:hypothetical protein